MDMQKSAASRVRHILAAMERSIDTARSRRVNVSPGAAIPVVPAAASFTSNPSAAANPRNGAFSAAPRVNHVPAPAPTSPANQTMGQMIGGNNSGNAVPAAPVVDPSQPPRLKARPKRFEGTFATPFNQPTYRSQAG